MNQHTYSLFNNSRFYILSSSILLAGFIFAALRLQIASDQLFYIRLEQVYGLVCFLYWYLALIISPIGYLIGKQRVKHLEFSRRAIGVSAALFALLHAGVALWGQLGGITEVALLPDLFKASLTGGFIALIILFAMAATSFDSVIKFMTFTRWKWLHRLVYIGGIVAVLHVWTIGTHLSYSAVQWSAFAALVILSGLETFRVVTLLAKKSPELRPKPEFYTLFTCIWVIWIALIFFTPKIVQNYHSQHMGNDHQQMSQSMDSQSMNSMDMSR